MPITVPDLHRLHHYIISQPISTHDKHLLWAASTLAFFGLLRSSEYTSVYTHQFLPQHTLISSNVGFAGDYSYMTVHIQSSKTDPFRDGCTIRVGATGNFLCPVSAMYNFIHQSTFISGPLFTYSDGSYLTRNRVALMLRSCFGNCRINTHSFRIGGASTMASAGIPDSTIMIMGRWSSNAYQQYLRLSDSLIHRTAQTTSRTLLLSKAWDSDILQSKLNN